MTLQEAVNQFTDEIRTAINTVGNKEVVVKRLSDEAKQEIDKTADKLYLALIGESDKIGFNTHILGIYPTLTEVKNHFISLSFAADLDPNGWIVSTEKGRW